MPDPIAPVMMTFAGIAYGKPGAIPSYLAQAGILGGSWTPYWIAADVPEPVNFAFIARNEVANAYAIAIRGTYPDPFASAYWDDSRQDSPFGAMQPWPGGSPDAKVSAGAWKGFQNLLLLSDGSNSFVDAVAGLPAGSEVYVTGHSLGGTLAPLVASWLRQRSNPVTSSVYCFAGTTPGNAAFAELLGEAGFAGRVWRYNNTLDTVPYGWDRVADTSNFYQPHPRGGLLVESAIETVAGLLVPYGYTTFGTEIRLAGQLTGDPIRLEFAAYLLENLHQHLPDTYLQLLGAPPLPFTIGFGAVVAEQPAGMDLRFAVPRIPVIHRSPGDAPPPR